MDYGLDFFNFKQWNFRLPSGEIESRKVERVSDPPEMPEGERLDLKLLPLPKINLSWILSETLNTLTVLNMGDCDLKTIPPAISNLINLQRLRVQSNSLTSLPREIGDLPSLTRLCAFGNKLRILPDTLQQLPKLKILRLGGNALAEDGLVVLEGIGSLKELYLRENPNLTIIPRRVALMASLQVLNADDNNIQYPPMTYVKGGLDQIRQYARNHHY